MRYLFVLFTALFLLSETVLSLSPAEWRSQSIYFLLTDRFGRTDKSTSASCDVNKREYCGGTWQGVINQLDYIQGMGFTAIWITPVTDQFYESTGDGTSYHGYWQQDIYEINPKLGTSDDLKSLADALHKRGMYLMVDVVPNHMGYKGIGSSVDYSVFNPFSSSSYFHPYCLISNYNDQSSVENCWLGSTTVSLPDLDTSQSNVRTIWYNWIRDLVSKYSIDGLRVDTVKHVEKSFWPGFNSAAGVYCVGEVFQGDPAYTCPYQNYMDGVLNYPIYYPLLRAFQSSSGSISDLYNMINSVSSSCSDPTLLGNFIENHDNPRFAHYTGDYSQAKNVISFLFLSDGIPIIYAGQEQHYSGGEDPANREATWLSGYSTSSELYTFIARTNAIRRLAVAKDSGYITARNTPFYQDSNTLAMRKGSSNNPVITVLSNRGSSGNTYTLTLSNTGYSSGTSLTELYTCSTITAGSGGSLSVPMASGQPRSLVPTSWLSGSGLCGSTGPPSTTLTTTTTAKPTTTCAAAATSLSVVFSERVTTSYGENIYLTGSSAQLGSWNPASGVKLSAERYTTANPLWEGSVSLPVGSAFEFKFVKKNTAGNWVWESDPNRKFTVPGGCEGGSVSVDAVWR